MLFGFGIQIYKKYSEKPIIFVRIRAVFAVPGSTGRASTILSENLRQLSEQKSIHLRIKKSIWKA